MSKKALVPALLAMAVMAVGQLITLAIAFKVKEFADQNQIGAGGGSFGVGIVYFLGVSALLGIIMFVIPIQKLKLALRLLFTFTYVWGLFILLALLLPFEVAITLAVGVGVLWWLRPRVWLQNLLMLATLVSVGAVFGFLFSPWTAMGLMLVISVYDVLAVRFGYMVWMAKRLSGSESLPAFIIPKDSSYWNQSLSGGAFGEMLEDKPGGREVSILGGGDIGFPLLLTVSVFFENGISGAAVVAALSLLGVLGAYWIQAAFLKGKPMPALPPITFACLVGLLLVRFVLPM